jgi:NitT/TauT family transport system substrate-binding protein
MNRACVVGLALGLLGLGAAPLHAEGAPLDVTMAVPTFSMSFSLQYIAEDKGYFAANGINMKSVIIAGVGATNAVISGSADAAHTSPGTLTRAAAHGQRLLAIVAETNRLIVDLALRKDLAEAAHFDPKAPLAQRALAIKGRIIAVDAINTVIHAYVRLLAHYGGFDPEDIRIAPMQPPNMIAAFESKEIDGFAMSLPWPLQPVLAGTAVMIASGPAGDPPDLVPFAQTLVAVLPETCEKRPAVCVGLGRSFAAAASFVRDHGDEALALLGKRFAKLDPKLLAAAFAEVRSVTPTPPAPSEAILKNADTYNIDAGLMKPEERLSSYAGLSTDKYVK